VPWVVVPSPPRPRWGPELLLGPVTTLRIEPNSYVTVAYELRGEDGELIDASTEEGGEPITYVHGYGMLVPGLEAALAGLAAGDKKDVVIPAEAGYGEYDEDLVIEIDRAEFPNPAAVEVGDEFVAEAPDGGEVELSVVEVRDDHVLVDANHPLAGVALQYHIEVQEVRPATAAEIERAAADLDEAHEHVHGPDCDHSHEHLVLPGLSSARGSKAESQTGKKAN
jgi:FKBP-type peptidyl-prolyl cis-trans isomerase SlyD